MWPSGPRRGFSSHRQAPSAPHAKEKRLPPPDQGCRADSHNVRRAPRTSGPAGGALVCTKKTRFGCRMCGFLLPVVGMGCVFGFGGGFAMLGWFGRFGPRRRARAWRRRHVSPLTAIIVGRGRAFIFFHRCIEAIVNSVVDRVRPSRGAGHGEVRGGGPPPFLGTDALCSSRLTRCLYGYQVLSPFRWPPFNMSGVSHYLGPHLRL